MFLQRHLPTDNLVCWKDQQNFTPFIDGVPPDTAKYTQALRYYADAAEFGIMPIYTADQADYQAALACGPCDHGSNNFSNINATLQARLYSKAIRDYPTPYITNGMYRKLIEWLSWNEDINGDNRFPDNNEFFFNWNPDDPDPRPVGHPPRRPGLVQLDGLPGHRRSPAAARRHGRALADRHGLRPLRRQQPELPRDRPDDRLAEAGLTARIRWRRTATRCTSAASAS